MNPTPEQIEELLEAAKELLNHLAYNSKWAYRLWGAVEDIERGKPLLPGEIAALSLAGRHTKARIIKR